MILPNLGHYEHFELIIPSDRVFYGLSEYTKNVEIQPTEHKLCLFKYICIVLLQVSVTFDPFMSLSVPIPRNLRLLPVIFVPCDPNTTPIKV